MRNTMVLVVEDEPFIRLIAVETIEGAGYRVLDAANADEALEILERRSDVDIVFTDVNMPGSMDGWTSRAAIHDRWPPIRLIVTSGKAVVKGEDIAAGYFLPKPYCETQLTVALAKLAA